MIAPAISNRINYNDKLIWLAGYPVAALSFLFFANDNPFAILIHLPTFISDLLFAMIVTFAVGFYLRWINRRFDKQLPWHQGFKNRLLWQFLFGVAVPLFVSMILETAYLFIINIPIASSSILNLELPLAFIFLLLANLFYLICYLYYYKNTDVIHLKEQAITHSEKAIEFIAVQNGLSEEKVKVENCALILSSNKLLWLHTYHGEQFRLKGTLEEWEEKLKGANFYRLNRQYLIALNAIRSTEQTDTRKLKVNFVIHVGEAYVSKPNVANFRKWWNNGGPS